MNTISTHVLDTAKGVPAEGIQITLEFSADGSEFKLMSNTRTSNQGRVASLLPEGMSLQKGVYRLTFNTRSYFANDGATGFYPYVPVIFEIQDPTQHYHVPILLSPYGYSTYRGS